MNLHHLDGLDLAGIVLVFLLLGYLVYALINAEAF
ncbi:K(+)-transporting ATPase subunit F [Enterobacter asburiae]